MTNHRPDHPLGLALRQLALATTVAAALGLGSAQAAINVGLSGSGTNNFSATPAATEWSTLNIGGSATDIASAAGLDSAAQALVATNITTALGTSGTNPPSNNDIARRNTALNLLQMRPLTSGGSKATVLMATLKNTTGCPITKLGISYAFNHFENAVEEVEGVRAYYSMTGLANSWTVIPDLCTATAGSLSTVVTLSSTWNDTSTMYVLWLDDNAATTDDANTIDDANFTPKDLLVAVTNPANNQAISYTSSITATAVVVEPTPATGPYTVQFYTDILGTGLIATGSPVTAPPYEVTFGPLTTGTYHIYATVTDSTAVTVTSGTNTFTVGNLPPAVAISSPAYNTGFAEGASVTIDATASDLEGTITKVEFFADGNLLDTDTSAPYSCTWVGGSNALHVLTAVATDDTSQSTTSAAVNIRIGPYMDISNVLTPWEPANPVLGVRIDPLINGSAPPATIARLAGLTQTHWGSGGFTKPVVLNGNTLNLDSGGGNGANYAGPISGNGTVTIQNNGQTIGGTVGNTYTGATNVKTVVTLNKSSGNALCGTITGTGAAITWSANDQIDDTSDVTLNSTSRLTLGAHTETIGQLYLVTGAYVDTGAGGILKVSELYLNGVQQAHVGKGSGDGFVLGTGYIDVGNSGPPVIATVPDKPASPVPTDGTLGLHPMFVTLLNWADAAGATSYDVYLWDASGSKPGTPTATGLSLSQYAPTLPLNSNATYNWQVVAQNAVGPTEGDVWTFTTTDASHVSNVLTPWESWNPDAGVRIDTFIPAGVTAVLVGPTRTHWGSGGFSRAVDLNGNTFYLDSGNGNGANYAGPISGNGTVTIQYIGQTIGGSLGNTYTGTTNVNTRVTLNKSSGNALCGTITGTGGWAITWAANDQINDASSVTLASGFSLALEGHTDTIGSLTLATGTSVNTGTGGVLTVTNLTVGGTAMPPDTYTASNSSFVTGTGSVVVPAAGTPYEIWAATNAGGQTPGEDANHDGVPNGIAYFMGMDGLATNPGVVNGKVTWPHVGTVSAFGVEVSDDLSTWSAAAAGDVDTTSAPGYVIYTLPTGAAKKFCRLSVTP